MPIMRAILLLFLLPATVLGCTNPDTDPCASYMTASAATASAFCKTYTTAVATATTGLPAWASSACSNKPSAISKECTCAFGSASATGTSTTTKKASSTTVVSVTVTNTGPAATATDAACGAPAVDKLVGYGYGATGGGSGSGVTVTTCAQLEAAVLNNGVITISGVLDGCDIIDLGSDTTVIGKGAMSGEFVHTYSSRGERETGKS